MYRESLTQLCVQLINIDGNSRRSDLMGPIESQLELRRRCNILSSSSSRVQDILAEEQHLRGLLQDAGLEHAQRREAMLCLATLLAAHPTHVDQRGAYSIVVQALREPTAALDHWTLSAALRLAAAVACACSGAPPSVSHRHDAAAAAAATQTGHNIGMQPGEQSGTSAAAADWQQAKRTRTGAQQSNAQPSSKQALDTTDPAVRRPASPRTLSHAHVCALHAGLIAWSAHWHPRCREEALAGLMALHGAPESSHKGTTDPCASGQAVTTGPDHTCAAYAASVACLVDDADAVRVRAASLVAALAVQAPCSVLPHPRFGSQAGQPLPLADDAFQRLCAAAACDGEAHVRAHALGCLDGLVHTGAGGTRVRLQALSKKATLKAALPSEPAAGSSHAQQQQQHQQRGKGGKSKGQTGRGSEAAPAGEDEGPGVWQEAPWGGKGSAHAALPLFDASVGALVHGSEDESSAVRLAVVGILQEIAAQEVQVLLRHRSRRAAHSMAASNWAGGGGGSGWGSLSPAASSALQACEQCCALLVDLLHDAVPRVRAAAALALERVCCPGAAAAETRGHAGEQGTAAQAAAVQVTLPLLDGEEIDAVIAALCDGCDTARHAVTRLLAATPLPSPDHLMQLASVLADVCARYPGDTNHVLHAIRAVAARMPDAARAAAAEIAKAASPLPEPATASPSGLLRQLPSGMVCLPRQLKGVGHDVESGIGVVVLKRPALLVMAALVEGAAGLAQHVVG